MNLTVWKSCQNLLNLTNWLTEWERLVIMRKPECGFPNQLNPEIYRIPDIGFFNYDLTVFLTSHLDEDRSCCRYDARWLCQYGKRRLHLSDSVNDRQVQQPWSILCRQQLPLLLSADSLDSLHIFSSPASNNSDWFKISQPAKPSLKLNLI